MSDEIIGLGKDDMLALKCANCELYLSVPPITMNEGEYYCGRCNIQGTRIEIYEELASHILFPCVNETCTRLLSWGNVANHETNCPHKLICCPFVNCIDVYEANEILVHFEDYHENHLYFENEICFFRRFRNLEFHKFTVDKRAYALSWGDLKYVVMVYMDAKEHRSYSPRMNKAVGLNREELTKLKCSQCQLYLSLPPIVHKNGKWYCGRCKVAGIRNDIYEELAKYMCFPCVHETCKLQLQWGQVANHELACPHKVILCPFINCKEKYKNKEFLAHFSKTHASNLFFTNELRAGRRFRHLSFNQFGTDRRVYAITYENLNYLVMVYLDAEKHPKTNTVGIYNFSFGVYSVQAKSKKKCYEVDIQIIWDSGIITNYNIKDQQILQFNDRIHCLKCIQGICSLEFHENKKNNFLPTKLAKLKNLGDMEVQFRVAIVNATEPQIVSNNKGKDNHSDLKCSKCRDYMCSPIYVCSLNHSFCISCKRRITSCNTCKTVILDTRNADLEYIAEKTEIPCHNKGKGCNYVGIIRRTKQHQFDCKYNFG
ncbi:unnamed protein product [Acanthoscelides obtectus]|uniref:RING-type E3 ubiquitin transferase n=1 Tax=Acanthoscelides obtectus TaxID=200917 RepID=A0A9P0L2D1_ACAOB|nr:unnamed protein product [Acanthoscelides obtectus]CAK1659818.1 E3 ubiquitin-protein ligase sina [Acanthoscelides obtectus]